ncbi:pentapeptide repeat-containing protein [Micromonospora sp. C81]|uniref:pentapeptide repeat-containing protein n=1 Tax=Micromonospora sp. C81 TaxID=2824881 RepID=UPI001B3688BF|nr:pentapeptide repeat-containing protein [Micromonospora sp. C81]MBQ1035351.1 pentapeptide repeat-containing protein [Micromonospora sp. C81]
MPELRLWGIRRSIALAVAVALLLVGGLIAAAFWYADWPGFKRDATVTAATLFDLLKLVFAVVAGVGGVAALVVAYRRQRVAEHTNALAEFAHQLAHAADLRAEATRALAEAADERAKIETDRNGVRLFNERFAKASEQLGSEKAAVRLAGVYAMAGLADDWREGRQTCIDVLCAYLRMPYSPPPDASEEGQAPADDDVPIVDAESARSAREEREVRHTVIRLVGRHLRLAGDDPTSWRNYDFDFTGAMFDGGDFSDVTFSGGRVSFAAATFGGGRVSFRRAIFIGGEVSFAAATFSGGEVSFRGATFSEGEVSFRRATFSGGQVIFSQAAFSGGEVSFFRAAFSGGQVSFSMAAFTDGEVSFFDATFSAGVVRFSRGNFTGGKVSFLMAKFKGGKVSFLAAAFSGGHTTFRMAKFNGGEVHFRQAKFTGGDVSFDNATFHVPPKFSYWPAGRRPEGLVLPEE